MDGGGYGVEAGDGNRARNGCCTWKGFVTWYGTCGGTCAGLCSWNVVGWEYIGATLVVTTGIVGDL